MSTSDALCPGCSGPLSPGVQSCPACGMAVMPASSGPEGPAPTVTSPWYRRLRLALMIWLVAYPVVSCAPVLLGTATGGVSIGLAALLVGATFFFPWLAGIVVLGILMLIAR